jgi:uncharacterized protein (TIGR02231 family)
MTRITLLIALLVIGSMKAISQKEKKAESKIEQVTVFLQGAQIKEKGKFTADKGVTKVIFEGMAPAYNQQSIQVKGKGEFIILDVSPRVFYPEPEEAKPTTIPAQIMKELRMLNDSIDNLAWEIRGMDDEIAALNLEKNLLLNSATVKGQSTKDSLLALTKAMEYMRIKLPEINKLMLKADKRKHSLQVELNEKNARKSELENYNYNAGYSTKSMAPVQQIVVSISADAPVNGTLELSYMVSQAGWTPSYDLRANDVDNPVSLTYKANVHQTTGVAWNDVKIKLSTINPNRSNVKPMLAPWYLSYVQPIQTVPGMTYNNSYQGPVTLSKEDLSSDMDDAKHIAAFTTMTENLTMVEFDLKINYSIPSDGQPYLMAIKNEEIKTTYEYFVIPKLDTDAYLVAYLTGWEEMNLLPAVANIYYDGTYVGQTRINPSVMSDKLELPLGRDNNLLVTRKKTKDEDKEKMLSNEKTKSLEYEIALRSMKSTAVKIVVEDQIPLSAMEDVKVEVGSIGKAEFITETGKLRWVVNLAPKETLKFKFSYDLKYDKDKSLALY